MKGKMKDGRSGVAGNKSGKMAAIHIAMKDPMKVLKSQKPSKM